MTQQSEGSKTNIQFSLDWRLVALVLLGVILAMLIVWKPWTGARGSDRTVEVTGEATLRAEPDEFVFYPMYQVEGGDKEAALKTLTEKSETVVAELKKLGVPEKAIKSNTSGFDNALYGSTENTNVYTTQLTVTLDKKDLAQKVQDYLITTTPTGGVSPQYGFSDKKRKTLESEARVEATKDARAKAEQMGENLGFTVAKIKSVSDGTGFSVSPVAADARSSFAAEKSLASLGLNPGENELPFAVTVVYFIK